MRKRLLTAALVIAVMTGAAPHATAAPKAGPCHLHRADDESVQDFSKRFIRCAVKTTQEAKSARVPGGAARAICIAKRESGLLPWVESPTGLYVGLFQHARRYWSWRFETYTDPDEELPKRMKSARTASLVTMRMVLASGGWASAGWKKGDC